MHTHTCTHTQLHTHTLSHAHTHSYAHTLDLTTRIFLPPSFIPHLPQKESIWLCSGNHRASDHLETAAQKSCARLEVKTARVRGRGQRMRQLPGDSRNSVQPPPTCPPPKKMPPSLCCPPGQLAPTPTFFLLAHPSYPIDTSTHSGDIQKQPHKV